MRKRLSDQVGFRPAANVNAPVVHANVRKVCALWFEFLKRVAILSVLWAASKNSWVISALYYLSLVALIIPIGTWLEQWELDLKTRKPKRYDPNRDEPPTEIPIPEDRPTVWRYSPVITFVWLILIGLGLNLCVSLFVEEVSRQLADAGAH